MIVQQLLTSFIASAAFGIIFNIPKKLLINCGFVGMVGWIIYFYSLSSKSMVLPLRLLPLFCGNDQRHICKNIQNAGNDFQRFRDYPARSRGLGV